MKVKTLILKFFGFLIFLFILDFGIGKILNYYYFKQKYGEYAVLTKTIENPTNQRIEILIMGSSRARRHYHPGIISATLGKSCYNAGYDAQSILFHKALLDIIEEKYKPEIIVLDVNMNELDNEEISYDQLSVLLPYASRYPKLWNTLLLKSPFERIKAISRIYPYNSLLDKIVKGNIIYQESDINGFMPFYGMYGNDLVERTFPEIDLDPNKVSAFNAFLAICREKNIQLYIVYSPEYVKSLNTSSSMNYIIETCQKQGIEYISYQNNESYLKNELFREYLHLNNVGAEKFSLEIASKIKEKMNEE
ncbi:MAG: DUF1574 domain-containing protein [Dysgonamonadaceae bacterium]|jgi:hypothetical protein|nr:DUF1574 domain-containing protein [Dysgonamonadaceae bacterium]